MSCTPLPDFCSMGYASSGQSNRSNNHKAIGWSLYKYTKKLKKIKPACSFLFNTYKLPKGVTNSYPLLTNDDLLKSQTVFLKKKDLYV